MKLLFTIFSGNFSSVFSPTSFGGANLAFSMLTDYGAKERKRHGLAEERLQRARGKWNEDRMKRLDFINKKLREKTKQRHTSIMLMKQCLDTIEYLQKNKTFAT